MHLLTFPFKYYAVLPESTLITKIREQSWNLDRLFPLIKQSKSELKKLAESSKKNPSDMLKLHKPIGELASEIGKGHDVLKHINFYDSAILYLYFRLLNRVFDLCKKEEAKIKENIKKYEDMIKQFNIEEVILIKAAAKLLNELRKLRWKAEKQAQHEFSLSKFTLRSLENLNRKVKTEAIKVKQLVPQENEFVARIKRKTIPEDVNGLVKIVAEAIARISKDVSYSSKLISKFEKEAKKLNVIVENLKKRVNKSSKDKGIASKIIKPWEDSIKKLEEQINKDLMQIFRNIFVEYKYIGTRPITA